MQGEPWEKTLTRWVGGGGCVKEDRSLYTVFEIKAVGLDYILHTS